MPETNKTIQPVLFTGPLQEMKSELQLFPSVNL